MGRPEADWKRQSRHALDWLSVALAIALAAAFLALWLASGRNLYAGVTALLAAWAGLYLSSLWQPIGYVLAAVVVAAAVLMMIVYGQWERPVAWATYPLAATFLGLTVYLFLAEERAEPADS